MKGAMWQGIERWLSFDPGRRGFAGNLRPGDLERGTRRLQSANSIAVATGFFIPAAQAVENDGPLGAVFLARALLALGKEVVLLVPDTAEAACQVLCQALGLNCRAVLLSPGLVSEQFIEQLGCDTLVVIEYPGQGGDKTCRNMRGADITPYVPLLDTAFNYAKQCGIFTIAVGDGGNELGCGGRGSVAVAPCGTPIAAVTEAEVVLAAGLSNWGVYALLAALSLLENKNMVPTPSEERSLLEKLCQVGVVDGYHCLCQATVDGQAAEVLAEVLQDLHRAVTDSLDTQRSVAVSSVWVANS
ncbi:MAG: DUF4392 domain-containing protein [Thermaerobacter sp.]|nr:DUF4392 domain-containing protein [Thermaerobacter sp.]